MITGLVFTLAATWSDVSVACPCRWASASHASACTAIVIRLFAAIAPPRCNSFDYSKPAVNRHVGNPGRPGCGISAETACRRWGGGHGRDCGGRGHGRSQWSWARSLWHDGLGGQGQVQNEFAFVLVKP